MILVFTFYVRGIFRVELHNFTSKTFEMQKHRNFKLSLKNPSLFTLDERLDELTNSYVNYLARLFKVVTVSTTDETRVPHVSLSRPLQSKYKVHIKQKLGLVQIFR